MQNWITDFMEQYGYIGIALIIALENVFPHPLEIILPFGGFMTTYTSLTLPGVIIAATIGSVLGAVILYGIGLLIDVNRLEKIVERWGHILRIKKEDIHRVDAWFDKYGMWTVLFCRMVPLVRSLISIPAGMSNMKFGLFILFTTIGTLAWNIIRLSWCGSRCVMGEYPALYGRVLPGRICTSGDYCCGLYHLVDQTK